MSDLFTIGGVAIDPIATDLLPVRFNERFGAIPTLTLQRRGIALPALPDPWVGQTVSWTNAGTTYFIGDVVSANPHFDPRIGWILTYQCLGLRNRLDWFPHTDSATGTYSTSFNLTLEDPSYNPTRAGRSVGQILTAILTMPANAATLNGYGIGAYTGLPNTPALPSDTVNDLAALTVIPPRPVYFVGEKLGIAIDAFLDQWAPNILWRIDPQTGHIRFLDTRIFPQQTLTMGQDPIEPTELARDTADSFQRVVVRGQPVAVMALLKLSRGDLLENFAWGSFTSAQAKAHWNPSQFKSPGAAQDTGSCSCPSTTTVTVTSSNPALSWTAGYWDQSHNQGTINLSSSSITDYTQFWSARIVNCPALSPGGSCTLTIDNPLPALSYDHYTITGLNTNTGSVVWRQYQIANPALWPRVTNQSTYPQAFVNPGGGAGMLTSTPMSQVLWSLNGSPPYLSFPLPFSTNATTATGNILFVAPTWSVANNAPPADVWVLIPIETNPNNAIDPPNDSGGNPTYTGTSNAIDGWTKTLTVDLDYWRDPSLLSQVQAYASDLLDSVKNAVLEGAVVYYGLYTPALTPGLALNIVGKLGAVTYPTMGWDTASDLAIREVSVEWPQTEGMAYKTTIVVSNRRHHLQAAAFLHPERCFLPIGASSLYEANAAFTSMYRPLGIADLLGAATNLEALAPDLASTAPNPAGFAPPDLALYGPGDLGRFNPFGQSAPGGGLSIPTSMADLGLPTTPGEYLQALGLLPSFAQPIVATRAARRRRKKRRAGKAKALPAPDLNKAADEARARRRQKARDHERKRKQQQEWERQQEAKHQAIVEERERERQQERERQRELQAVLAQLAEQRERQRQLRAALAQLSARTRPATTDKPPGPTTAVNQRGSEGPSMRADDRSWLAREWSYRWSQMVGWLTHYGAREREQALTTPDLIAARRHSTPFNRLFHGLVKPVAQGFVEGAEDFYKGIRHPITTLQGSVQGLYIIITDSAAVGEAAYMKYEEFEKLSETEKNDVIMRLGGKVLFSAVTEKGLSKAKELAKLRLLTPKKVLPGRVRPRLLVEADAPLEAVEDGLGNALSASGVDGRIASEGLSVTRTPSTVGPLNKPGVGVQAYETAKLRAPGPPTPGETRIFSFIRKTPTPAQMAELQARMAKRGAKHTREVVYIEYLDGTRELRLGTLREAEVPIRGDIRDLVHTQPSHGLPSGADLKILRRIIKAGSPIRELKVVAPDGTLYIHHLDKEGNLLRGKGGRLKITVVRPGKLGGQL